MTDRHLIKVAFPLKQTSLDSAREKNVRHGHISTLHNWPARRPLAACRATAFAALIDDPGPDHPQERDEIRELIKEMSPWEVVKDGNSPAIQKAWEMILAQYGRPPSACSGAKKSSNRRERRGRGVFALSAVKERWSEPSRHAGHHWCIAALR